MSEFTKMKITLDFYNKNIVSVSAKQYDNQSRYIEISCTENGKAFLADKNTMSAYIRYRKPDGLGCFNECEITDEGNILVELTEQMLSAHGKAEADIMLLEKVFTSGEKPTDIEDIYEIHAPVISVMSFYVNIAPTALNHAQIESSYEFNALSNALSQIDYNNKKVEALDKELTENENERKTAETARVNAENTRKTNETVRINAENIRKAAETERKANEAVRQSNETTRQTQENKRQTDTATAISNANAAAQNANNKANDLQNKLDSHHFVLTEDKDVAGGVAGLDSNAKVPISELYDASTTSKGIVQLTNSVASTSTTTAATPNSVKVAYDKTLSVETALNNEITRATAAENAKANIANPTFTGTPKAPTAAAGTNSTQIATTAFVQTAVSSGIAASDAMIVKGTIGTNGTVTALPTTYKTGWTYRVTGAGTYAGQVCEIGDLIIALVDRNGSGNTNSDWCVAQTNINGAITGVKSGDAYIQASQTGSVVTITHKDVTATNTTSSVSPAHGGKFTAVKSVARDTKGHITGVDTETVTLPAAYTLPTASSTVLGGIKTGTNITNSSGTISLTKQNVINALGYTPGTGSGTAYSTGTATYSGITKLYTGTGSATDGTMTQNAITSALNGKAASSHTHSYIPLAGSSAITGNLISSTNKQKNLGDKTHEWNEVWTKSLNINTEDGDGYAYGMSYVTDEETSDTNISQGLYIGNMNDIEGIENSHTIYFTDDCNILNTLTVARLQGTGVTNLIKKIYPVGSIYISTVSTNPSTLFGFGTWTQIKDTFLLAAGTTYKAGSTGGSATHTLTVNEIPSHTHKFTGTSTTTTSSGNHTHSVTFTTTAGASNMLGAFGGSDGNSIGNTSTTTTSNGSHTHGFTAQGSNSNTGAGQAHNNMPPYLTVYMWKRTA